jgi:hypothetical protein
MNGLSLEEADTFYLKASRAYHSPALRKRGGELESFSGARESTALGSHLHAVKDDDDVAHWRNRENLVECFCYIREVYFGDPLS